jgi:hypothetical protein
MKQDIIKKKLYWVAVYKIFLYFVLSIKNDLEKSVWNNKEILLVFEYYFFN